jgi:hypothetical protein
VNSPGVVGAGYVAAMLTGDDELSAAYEVAFSPTELLQALHSQLLILGRRVAVDSNRTPAELGDQLIGAALLVQRLHLNL